jgi:hypothetical protein
MQESREDQSPESTLEAHDDARIQGPARIADCRLSPIDDDKSLESSSSCFLATNATNL